jgi:hypothetical protein
VGTHPVRVLETGQVASVVFELDGAEVGRVSESPWVRQVDFGAEYAPHELVARALDARGREVARVRQWINLPRPPAEVDVLVERDAAGRARAATLSWASREGPKPEGVTLTFDGQALLLDGAHRAVLPDHDPLLPHVLTARLDFGAGVESRKDLVLGGGSSGEAESELTAVPVRGGGGEPVTVESMEGRLVKDGRPLRVIAVERPAARVVIVRDLDVPREVRGWLPALSRRAPRDWTALEPDDLLQVQWPVARDIPNEDGKNVVFDATRTFRGSEASLASMLQLVRYPGANASPRRFSDAVAIAGLQAAGSYSRRAVVLVLGTFQRDQSVRRPDAVGRYLERLRVPLYVWSFAGSGGAVPAAAWGRSGAGGFEDVSSAEGMRRAFRRLQADLESQSIVWVEGRHLPQQIGLVGKGGGVSLVE